MKKMKVFNVYIDDGGKVFKILVPAFTKKDVENYVSDSGKIAFMIETNDYPLSSSELSAALKNSDFCDSQIEIVTRALSQLGLSD